MSGWRATPDNPEVRRDEALYVLIEHAPAIALDVARTATNEGVVFPAVFAAIAKLAPDELVTEWIAQNQLGPTKCLRGLDPQLLSDDTLVALTSMLLDSFPFAEDSDQSNDFTRTQRRPTRAGCARICCNPWLVAVWRLNWSPSGKGVPNQTSSRSDTPSGNARS
ncbi:hypothetical protein GS425_05470 [Rhodococcus hoagii]|nr:hypothetical protein [Prescottella equi]